MCLLGDPGPSVLWFRYLVGPSHWDLSVQPVDNEDKKEGQGWYVQ